VKKRTLFRQKAKKAWKNNMRTKLKIIINASAVSILTFSALAQNTPTPNPKTIVSDYSQDPGSIARPPDRLNDAIKTSDVIGMTVRNNQEEKLGKVEDLAVDLESGRLVLVILSTGGLAGIGDTLTAVPPGALHHDVAHQVLHLNADKGILKSAPKFEMSKWAQCCDSNHLAEVYRIYGQEPVFKFIRQRDAILKSPRNTDSIPESRLSYLQKASKLSGIPVKNLQDEKLGRVEDILLDLPLGRVMAVIVSSGGFLGIGDQLSAVPPAVFRFTAERENLQLDASKEMLTSAPHFKANRWPDFGQPSYVYGIYRAYRVEPYFSTSAIPDVDNTAHNVRDHFDRTATPLDQGNSQADLDITAQIRKEIIANKDLSMNARNVKIITNKGRVTLRGPVNTAEEKRLIGEIALRIAGRENVDNELEVKFTTSSSN
jgi:hyperosmotically inducible protein